MASLRYRGSFPVARLDLVSPVLPVEASLFGFSAFRVNDMNASARPSVSFTLAVSNPSPVSVPVGFLFLIPLNVETDQYRGGAAMVPASPAATSAECAQQCRATSGCQSWAYLKGTALCTLSRDAPMNIYTAGLDSGLVSSYVGLVRTASLVRAKVNFTVK